MLLLSSGAFEHGVIEQLTAQNSEPSIPITPDHSHKAVDGAVHPSEQYWLMPEKKVLGLKPAPRLEQVGERRSNQMEDGKHRVG